MHRLTEVPKSPTSPGFQCSNRIRRCFVGFLLPSKAPLKVYQEGQHIFFSSSEAMLSRRLWITPRHSMGLASLPTLGWFQGSTAAVYINKIHAQIYYISVPFVVSCLGLFGMLFRQADTLRPWARPKATSWMLGVEKKAAVRWWN